MRLPAAFIHLLLGACGLLAGPLLSAQPSPSDLRRMADNVYRDSLREALDFSLPWQEYLPPKKDRAALLGWAEMMRLRALAFTFLEQHDSAAYCIGKAEVLLRERKAAQSPPALALSCVKIRTLGLRGYFIESARMADSLLRGHSLSDPHPVTAYLWIVSGDIAWAYGDFPQALHAYQQAIAHRKRYGPYLHSLESLFAYVNLANAYLELGEVSLSEAAFDQADAILREEGGGRFTEGTLYVARVFNLASLGRNEEALQMAQAAQVLFSGYPQLHEHQSAVFSRMGSIHAALEDEENAQRCLELALREAEQMATSLARDRQQAICLMNLSMLPAYSAQSDSLLQLAQAQLARALPHEPGLISLNIALMGKLGGNYIERGAYEQADSVLNACISQAEKYYGPNAPAISYLLNNLGVVYKRKGQHERAAALLTRALAIERVDWEQPRPFANASNPTTASYVLWNLAETHQAAEAENPALHPQEAFRSYDRYVNFLDEIRSSYQEGGAQQGFAAENRIAYSRACESFLRITPDAARDPAALERLWSYLERSRGLILLEALLQHGVSSFEGVPGERIAREAALRHAAIVADASYFQEQNHPLARPDTLAARQHRRFSAQQAYERYLDLLRLQHPDYFQARHSLEVLSLAQTQALLDDSTAILSYFIGETRLLAMLVRRDTVILHDAPLFAVEEAVEGFRQGLWGYHSLPEQLRSDAWEDSCLARLLRWGPELRLQLIAPFEGQLPRRLILIPDGSLSYLPFAALPQPPAGWDGGLQSLRYLLQDHTVSYAISATLHQEMSGNSRPGLSQTPLLGMAPFFLPSGGRSEARGEEPALQHSGSEVRHAAGLLGGSYYLGEGATKARFLLEAPGAELIHLSTHGRLTRSPTWDFALLFAAPDDSAAEARSLHIREVYALRLRAGMVVLSACETGIGELSQGEGIISIGRAFAYAGARSILTSLWQVDDKATEEIMIACYEHMRAGKNKTEALAAAQRAYLAGNRGSTRSHPFYWAAFSLMGDISPLFP